MSLKGEEGLGSELAPFNGQIDPNVAIHLPKRCRMLSIEPHGVSFWARTYRINVELAGTKAVQSFFIKVISSEVGRDMMHSEFECTKTIHRLMPNFVPQPVAWGSYRLLSNTHFYLCEFREMSNEMPDPDEFTARLAELHCKSNSPEGKFGFHMTTFNGNLPQLGGWESSWETYFTKSMRLALELELKVKGCVSVTSLFPDRMSTCVLTHLEPGIKCLGSSPFRQGHS